MIKRLISKKTFAISLALTAVLSSFSVNSFALYDSIPYNDSTEVMKYLNANISDIAATDNSIILNYNGWLTEYNSGNFGFSKYGKVSNLENIDWAREFGVTGTDNDTKRIYFDCMNTNTNYISYPSGVLTVYAVNTRVKWVNGTATLYIDLSTPGKYYGSLIKEYRYYPSSRSLGFIKQYQTGYYERNDFAWVNNTKLVGTDGYYFKTFRSKPEINGTVTSDKGVPSGFNCHGYIPSDKENASIVSPLKLAFGNGYYYSIVKNGSYTDIVRTEESKLQF